jgi:enolase-phosphatase E1
VNRQIILLDIEGTIGDINFVRTVLFPYAEERFETYLTTHANDGQVRSIVDQAGLIGQSPAQAAAQFLDWSRADRKFGPLKSLQGLIWHAGYADGVLRAHLYDDAVAAIKHWHHHDAQIWIYSSGSIAAQKLYFRYAQAGDLTPCLAGHFDTTIGAKVDAASYLAIAKVIGCVPEMILFLTDAPAEAKAARAAGIEAMLIDRSKYPGWQDVIEGIPAAGSLKALF